MTLLLEPSTLSGQKLVKWHIFGVISVQKEWMSQRISSRIISAGFRALRWGLGSKVDRGQGPTVCCSNADLQCQSRSRFTLSKVDSGWKLKTYYLPLTLIGQCMSRSSSTMQTACKASAGQNGWSLSPSKNLRPHSSQSCCSSCFAVKIQREASRSEALWRER